MTRGRRALFYLTPALGVWLLGALMPGVVRAEPVDLTQLGLEELLNLKVEVTSAAKKPQPLSDVAAAVYVLTADDIRRSGATSIPEALRFVPGLDVAQVDRNSWAISARGFDSTFANKLLVLIDGRSIYSPLFSGVFWSLETTLMEDIERIEVIRGPGAALWGANAVDGVINIITKDAKATQGTLLVGGGGTEKTEFGAARYGGRLGEDGHYRVYAQQDRIAPGTAESGAKGSDSNNGQQAGFRADWNSPEADNFTLLSSAHSEKRGEEAISPSFSAPYMKVVDNGNNDFAANVLGRWTHTFSANSNLSVQTYYMHQGYDRPDIGTQVDVGDIQVQHRFSPLEGHDAIWGGETRWSRGELDGNPNFFFDPSVSTQTLASAFFQDDWALVPQTLHLIAGSKIEHNDASGFAAEPNLRLLWTPEPRQSIWGAVSRAVRTPNIGEEHINGLLSVSTNNGLPTGAEIIGNSSAKPERVDSLEAGYRFSPSAALSFDNAVFYNFNRDLVSDIQGTPSVVLQPSPHVVVPLLVSNGYAGRSWGLETASEWRPVTGWRLRASYSYLGSAFHLTEQNTDQAALLVSGQSPRHQVVLQSCSDLGHNLEFDVSVKHVSALPALNISDYATADIRLAWTGIDGVELSLVGQNLGDGSRVQFVPDLLPWVPTKIGPSVYGKAVIRF